MKQTNVRRGKAYFKHLESVTNRAPFSHSVRETCGCLRRQTCTVAICELKHMLGQESRFLRCASETLNTMLCSRAKHELVYREHMPWRPFGSAKSGRRRTRQHFTLLPIGHIAPLRCAVRSAGPPTTEVTAFSSRRYLH